jgi:hypothetical protein
MIDKSELSQLISDAIVAVFEQGLDEEEHFRTSLSNFLEKEQLEKINEDDINLAMQLARSELKDLIFVMIDELINKK